MNDTRLGTLHTEDGCAVLRFERRFAHPLEKVWAAVTEPEQMKMWFPSGVEVDLRPGGVMRFIDAGEDGATFEGAITALDPPRLIAYTWGEDALRFELHTDGAGCLLVFTHSFDDGAKAARDGAGWHTCLDMLEATLNGESREWSRERWDEVHKEYVASFPAEFSTRGP
ncbi:MAG: SRPBCC family protein [Dehalococcoidia bacterium]